MKSLGKKVMKLIYWLRNRKEYKNTRKINLSSILNYFDAQLNVWKSTSNLLQLEKHIEEQSIWRLSEVKQKSPECLEPSGHCTNCNALGDIDEECMDCGKGTYSLYFDVRCRNCGCNTVEKSFEMRACEEGCYPERMNKEEWEQFKQNNKIDKIC